MHTRVRRGLSERANVSCIQSPGQLFKHPLQTVQGARDAEGGAGKIQSCIPVVGLHDGSCVSYVQIVQHMGRREATNEAAKFEELREILGLVGGRLFVALLHRRTDVRC